MNLSTMVTEASNEVYIWCTGRGTHQRIFKYAIFEFEFDYVYLTSKRYMSQIAFEETQSDICNMLKVNWIL